MERFAFDLMDEDRNSLNKPLVVSSPSEVAGTSEAMGLSGTGCVPLPYDLPAEWEHNPFRVDLFTCMAEDEQEEEDVEFLDDEDELDDDEEIDDDEDLEDDDLEDEDLDEDYDEDLAEDDEDL